MCQPDLFSDSPIAAEVVSVLTISSFETVIGNMVAVASEDLLYLLEFENETRLQKQMDALARYVDAPLEISNSSLHKWVSKEVNAYLRRDIKAFETPICSPGTPFQEMVWEYLRSIPYGQTVSYGDLAARLGMPQGQRAVGQAVGDNRLAIIIPCHRVVTYEGKLGGYAGGLWRKRWLLDLEAGNVPLL